MAADEVERLRARVAELEGVLATLGALYVSCTAAEVAEVYYDGMYGAGAWHELPPAWQERHCLGAEAAITKMRGSGGHPP